MRTTIPENLKGKELFKFLFENKASLIATKKAALKKCDPVIYTPELITPIKAGGIKAADPNTPIADPKIGNGAIDVKVVANTAWWCDSHMDVLTDKCYNKSVKEKGNLIPHIKDHVHESDNHVGDVNKVYTMTINLKDLGINMPGTTTVLVFETTILEEYNSRVYKFYKNGKINKHSIGLIYISIGLCINDKDYLPEYELWNKYYDKVINKDVVDERGYFWIVPEINVMENSCVLFAACDPTPTLESEEKTDTIDEPDESSTHEQPSHKSSIITVTDLFTFN